MAEYHHQTNEELISRRDKKKPEMNIIRDKKRQEMRCAKLRKKSGME
jgi:hypothetical protein